MLSTSRLGEWSLFVLKYQWRKHQSTFGGNTSQQQLDKRVDQTGSSNVKSPSFHNVRLARVL
jgi:hypothetical protein